MGTNQSSFEKKQHLFRLEVLIEEPTHTLALAALLQALSHPKIEDFRIVEGLQFGKLIEKAESERKAQPIPIPPGQSVPVGRALEQAKNGSGIDKAKKGVQANTAKSSEGPSRNSGDTGLNLEHLMRLKESGTLVRIVAVKGKGVKLSIPCRILNYDSDNQQLTIYHVDERTVYSFKLNEIEDITT
ncbi:hypothetical protein [Paenibacillus ginsengarvi]|uniref:Uncharacterized protein n=1 Tax=Paenibacillus ginsengarvi TaxID=400777 RepID=A0A3B0CLD1_9BACL|nr:hypothetical protein [Paenibacillus ginsengarvi]RKN85671.1 hypothetical protein D7M11_08315 [Paenibacillus ginsengarvi]